MFDYDRSLYAIHENGKLIATIAGDGRLDLPFVEDERASQLLGRTPTLDALRNEA